MKAEDIKNKEDANNFVEGCINDFEAGISTKSETITLLGEYTEALIELFLSELGKFENKQP